MDVNKEIRIMLIESDMNLTQLAKKYGEMRGKECTLTNLSQRLINNKMGFYDVEMLAKIMGYKIKFEKE